MEYNGLKLDVDACQKADDETQIKIKEKEKQLFGLFPHFNNVPINLNSNDHKSCMLYGGTIIETMPVPIGVFKTGARAGQVKYKNTEFKHELPRLVNPLPDYRDWEPDRKSTRLNSSHITRSRMPSSA